jgi:hypothetical protein
MDKVRNFFIELSKAFAFAAAILAVASIMFIILSLIFHGSVKW